MESALLQILDSPYSDHVLNVALIHISLYWVPYLIKLLVVDKSFSSVRQNKKGQRLGSNCGHLKNQRGLVIPDIHGILVKMWERLYFVLSRLLFWITCLRCLAFLKDSRSQVENQGSMWRFERIMELWRQPIWSHDTDHLALWSQRCVCLSAFFSLGKSLFSLVCRRSDPDTVMFSLFNMWESFQRRAQVLWLTIQPLCPSPKDSRDSELTSSPGNEPFKTDTFRSLRLHTFFVRLISNYF